MVEVSLVVPIRLPSELVRTEFAKLRGEIQHPNCPMTQASLGRQKRRYRPPSRQWIRGLRRGGCKLLLKTEGVKCQSSCPSFANPSRRTWKVTAIGKMFSYLSEYSCSA